MSAMVYKNREISLIPTGSPRVTQFFSSGGEVVAIPEEHLNYYTSFLDLSYYKPYASRIKPLICLFIPARLLYPIRQ